MVKIELNLRLAHWRRLQGRTAVILHADAYGSMEDHRADIFWDDLHVAGWIKLGRLRKDVPS
jgi:hypothetical protein